MPSKVLVLEINDLRVAEVAGWVKKAEFCLWNIDGWKEMTPKTSFLIVHMHVKSVHVNPHNHNLKKNLIKKQNPKED